MARFAVSLFAASLAVSILGARADTALTQTAPRPPLPLTHYGKLAAKNEPRESAKRKGEHHRESATRKKEHRERAKKKREHRESAEKRQKRAEWGAGREAYFRCRQTSLHQRMYVQSLDSRAGVGERLKVAPTLLPCVCVAMMPPHGT